MIHRSVRITSSLAVWHTDIFETSSMIKGKEKDWRISHNLKLFVHQILSWMTESWRHAIFMHIFFLIHHPIQIRGNHEFIMILIFNSTTYYFELTSKSRFDNSNNLRFLGSSNERTHHTSDLIPRYIILNDTSKNPIVILIKSLFDICEMTPIIFSRLNSYDWFRLQCQKFCAYIVDTLSALTICVSSSFSDTVELRMIILYHWPSL